MVYWPMVYSTIANLMWASQSCKQLPWLRMVGIPAIEMMILRMVYEIGCTTSTFIDLRNWGVWYVTRGRLVDQPVPQGMGKRPIFDGWGRSQPCWSCWATFSVCQQISTTHFVACKATIPLWKYGPGSRSDTREATELVILNLKPSTH